MVIRLGWLGFGPTTFLLTEPADAYSEYGTWSHTSQAKPSKKKKRLPSSCKIYWQCCIRIFSHFGILDGHSLLWWSPVLPVVGACVLAVYIQNLKSLALYPMKSPSSFPSFALRSASDGKLHWWEPGNKTIHPVLTVNQNQACLWSQFIAAEVCLIYVAATCTK